MVGAEVKPSGLGPAALLGGLAVAAVSGCGARTELELAVRDDHDADASVVRDAAPLFDRHHRDREPDAAGDAGVVDRMGPVDGDSRDEVKAPEDGAKDATFDAGRDSPSEARDASIIDVARDSFPEARSDAAIDVARDSPPEAPDASDGANVEDTATETAVDGSFDGSTCDMLGQPARRFKIGVVESPAGVSYVLPDGGTIEAIADCSNRMTSVFGSYADVERIPLSAIDDRLPRYDLVVLCSDWAEYDWTSISPHAPAFTGYVTGGGGLLMYQPIRR